MRHGSSVAEQVWNRAGGRCEYCRILQAYDELTFEAEHIISMSLQTEQAFALVDAQQRQLGQVEILVGPCADRSRLLAATINLSWSRPC